MSVETPDRAVFAELERELVRAARRRSVARSPRAAGVLVPVLAAAVTIAVVVVAVTSLGRGHRAQVVQTSVPSGPPAAVIPVSPRERSNEQTARRAAAGLLDVINLPAGTLPVSGDASTSAQLGGPTGDAFPGANQFDFHSFWRVPGKPSAVITWIERHPPAGSTGSGTGGGGSGGVTLHWNVTFGYPAIPGRISSRTVSVTTAAAGGGGTAVRVDSEAIWVIPRPRTSMVPATVSRIEWSSEARGTHAVDHTFTSRASVRELVGSLNAVPLLRPQQGNLCFSPNALHGFRFVLLASGRTTPVAVAMWSGCGGVALDIAGQRYYLWLDPDRQVGSLLASAFMGGSIP